MERSETAGRSASDANSALPTSAAGFSAQELAAFNEQGFYVIRGMADPETRRQMMDCVHAAFAGDPGPVEYEADLHYPGAPVSRSEVGGNTIRRLKEAYTRHSVFTRFLVSPAVSEKLKQILGPKVVMPLAHHNCIMTKQPRFSSETGWHQDVRYWSFERPDLVSVWVALGRETPENGCLYVIPGTHKQSFAPEQLDDALFLRADLPGNAPLIAQKTAVPLDPGDVLFFHARTFHAAGRNLTDQTKYSAVFTFRAADNPPQPGTRSASMPELLLP
ncbi:MAG: phytanoyl-CoA dioxygenase family protein [Planctomycetes bacterium]|nr:phytanoyl-CoA dioxygenase family protein [Planctomycetota bacterium]